MSLWLGFRLSLGESRGFGLGLFESLSVHHFFVPEVPESLEGRIVFVPICLLPLFFLLFLLLSHLIVLVSVPWLL